MVGRGGMGAVFKVRQPRLKRLVALKILLPEKQGDPQFVERFEREAGALASLNHPNIVTVYDSGKTSGLYYLLMEFVPGLTLRQVLLQRRLTPAEALILVPQICEALQYAHERGHRPSRHQTGEHPDRPSGGQCKNHRLRASPSC